MSQGAISFWYMLSCNTCTTFSYQTGLGPLQSLRPPARHLHRTHELLQIIDSPSSFYNLSILINILTPLITLERLAALSQRTPFFLSTMPLHWVESDRITIPNASTRGTPIIDASLSHRAHFLAVGYGKQIEVWDLRKAVSSSPLSIFAAKSSLLTSFSWAPDIPRLAAGHEDGVVYVASLNERSAAIEGFNLQAPSLVISAVFLHKDLLAVATTQAVELRCFQYGQLYLVCQ